MRHTPRHLRAKQRLVFFLAFTFLFNTLFPSGFAAAQVVFSRPGPGVSRLPLNVSAFDAPGFGDVADAVNLATGNVYVSLDSMSRNNLTGENAEDAVGNGQWQLLPRMRLVGFGESFGKNIPLMLPLLSGGTFAPLFVTGPVPETLTLSQGDGSNLYFEKVTSLPSNPPSWLERYRSTLNSSAYLYQLRTEAGVQYAQDCIVYLPHAGGSFAHYYTQDGTRYTFHKDGEYIDYVQDTYQQYGGAKDYDDPNGSSASSPKTEFSYATAQQDPKQQGRITKIKDAYGRVTTYEWNFSNDTLTRINYLLSNEADNNSYARRAEFSYTTPTGSGQRVVDKVTYTADDGSGTKVSRWIDFDHIVTGGRVLVHKIKRQVLGGVNSVDITYGYDSKARVITVDQTSQPQIKYSYQTSYDHRGPQVTVSQGAGADGYKSSTYVHNAQGQLVYKYDVYRNQDSSTGGEYNWFYTYDDNGSIESIEHPGGKFEGFGYDDRGNLTSHSTSWNNGGPVSRQQTFSYDHDNRLVSDTLEGQSFTLDNATYTYEDVTWSYSYEDFAAPANHPNFTPATKVTRTLKEGGADKYSVTDAYLTSGFLQNSTRAWKDADGIDRTQTTTYAYHTGASSILYRIKSNGTSASYATKQYGDLLSSVTVSGLGTTTYRYDPLGNLAYEYQAGAFVSGYSGTTPSPNPGSDRTVTRTHNGFGQLTGEQVGGASKPGSNRYLAYYPTGELKYSWEGGPKNITQYFYFTDTTSADFGRLESVYRGIDNDSNGTFDVKHERTMFTYDEFGRVEEKTVDDVTKIHKYVYDTYDRVVRETRPDGGYTRYTYDATGEMTGQYVSGSGWTYFERDALGRATKVTYPAYTVTQTAATVLTTYDPYDRPVKVVDNRLTMNNAGDDRASYFVYDSRGNLTKELGPVLSSTTNRGYTDARRPYTEYVYDALGQQVEVKKLVNASAAVSVSKLEMPAASDANKKTASTSIRYDVYDRPVTLKDPLGFVTTLGYDASSNLVNETKEVWNSSNPKPSDVTSDFNSVTTRYAYDSVGRTTQVMSPRAGASEAGVGSTYTTYDALGNVLTQKDARGVVTHVYGYTDDGLLWRVAEPKPDLTTATATGLGANGAAPTNYVITKEYSYGTRRFPSSLKVAHQDTEAPSSPALPALETPEAQPFNLESPTTALPPSLGEVSSADVAAPESTTGILPPGVGDANEVTAPGETAPPSVGTNPSDGVGEVAPPSSIATPTIPPIGNGAPDAISKVAPPIGWEPANEVEVIPLDQYTSPGCQDGYAYVGYLNQCYPSDNLNKDYLKHIMKRDKATGGNAYDKAVEEEKRNQEAILTVLAHEIGYDKIENIELIAEALARVINHDPEVGLKLARGLNIAISLGNLKGDGLDVLADGLRATLQMPEHVSDDVIRTQVAMQVTTAVYSGDLTNSDYKTLIAVATSGADFIPGLGDGKGILEAIRGKQFGTDRTLRGAERWLGLAGLVGLAELRYIRYADDAIGVVSMASRHGDEVMTYADDVTEMIVNCARRNSFSEDTPVATAAGAIAIGSLKDDGVKEVYAYDEGTGEVGLYTITAFHENDDPVTVNLTVDPNLLDDQPGEVIETTPEHPFYVLGEWVDAEDLEVGMPVSTFEGETLVHNGTVISVEHIEETQTMYNLTVDKAHTFFVGEGQWLVHNCSSNLFDLPKSAFTTNNVDTAFGLLEKNNGINRNLASERLHKIKLENGFGGADNVVFDASGGVYNPTTGEFLGSLTQGGAKKGLE